MAFKLALISFCFDRIENLAYDPEYNFNFARYQKDNLPDECIQPVIKEAFERIRLCIVDTISSNLTFGLERLVNVNNIVHFGHVMYNAILEQDIHTSYHTTLAFYAKFFRLEPTNTFKVLLDIEEMPSTGVMNLSELKQIGFQNEQVAKLVKDLDERFSLNGRIEYSPIVKRGITDVPRFLISSDSRVMEYDFNKVLYHKKSAFQDIKIVSSPSLGNTLLLDDLQNLAEADTSYTHALMEKGKVSYKDKEILILGGGDGALLYELLLESPKMVHMAEIDADVIDACRKHMKPFGKILEQLEGPNHRIMIADCIEVLRKSLKAGKKYDMIFSDLTDIPVVKRPELLTAFDSRASQPDSPWAFIEVIFNLSLECLADDGLYFNHTTGKSNVESIKAYEDFLRKSKIPVEFEQRSAYVPSFMEIWVFHTVKKAKSSAKE